LRRRRGRHAGSGRPAVEKRPRLCERKYVEGGIDQDLCAVTVTPRKARGTPRSFLRECGVDHSSTRDHTAGWRRATPPSPRLGVGTSGGLAAGSARRGALVRKPIVKAAMMAAIAGAVLCASAGPTSAYTIQGVIRNPPVAIALKLPIRPGIRLVKVRFSLPSMKVPNPYLVTLCVGLNGNPCGSPGARTFEVLEGRSASAAFKASLFPLEVLTFLATGEGEGAGIRFSVTVN